ncbi:MAG: Hsp20/alpha crystallin family protein, partial [Candidatus Dormibacteria bacterium]
MTRWDPWRDLFAVTREANQLWNHGLYQGAGDSAPAVYLPLDIRQTDREYLVEASAPGFTPEQVEVVADGGVLTIRG